ncbi:MAG: glycoside hydrolase family 3 C-terminal domain-containing protein [Ignavibacteriaceae bacterium]|nr:glycoside hydrolase family 3 C-terminal domain-containing protein [Ignavibacteriaceae bacterium]
MKNHSKFVYPSVFDLSKEDKIWIEGTIENLSLYEKCAQLVFPWVLGNFLSEDSADYKRLVHLVKDLKVGGLIFFSGDILNQALLTNKMQVLANIPLLIASDFERGLGMRLKDGLEFPYSMALAATGNLTLSFKLGKVIAEEARAMGVHQNYAPVADLNDNPSNPIINIRAFSADKKITSEFCSAFIRGTTSARVLTTAKHFPGHGNTHVDSHLDIPLIKGSKKYLLNNELVPFSACIKAGVHSIMVGHLAVPSIEKNPKITATLSKKIITDLLIKKLGFDGLIMTDAMNMDSVCKNFSAADATIRAFKAGNDMILFPPDEEIAVDALNSAVKRGQISQARIDHSLRKLLSAKRWLKIDENRFVNLNDIPKSLSTKEHLKLAQTIADKSITLVKNEKKIVPLNKSKSRDIFWITITEGLGNELETFYQSLLQEQFPNSIYALVHQETNDEYYTKILNAVEDVDIVILSSFIRVKAYQGSISISQKHEEFVKDILKLKTKSVLISFGNPYLLSVFPEVNAYLCAYGDTKASQQAVLKALKGEIKIQGKLPI